MNWDAIGAIGEIVGATAVVISLAYLAIQIAASNHLARAEAFRVPNSYLNSLNASFMQIEEFREALVPAMNGSSRGEIVPKFALVLDVYLVSVTNIYEQLYREIREGILDESILSEFGAGFWFHTTYYKESWPIYRRSFGSSFAEEFEQRFDLAHAIREE